MRLEDTDLEAAAARIVRDRGGMRHAYLEQLGTFGSAERDPRGWSVSIAYFALVRHEALSDRLEMVPFDALPPLAFDHAAIVREGRERVARKSVYSTLPAFLLDEPFSIQELFDMYVVLSGRTASDFSMSSFRRRLERAGVLARAEGRFASGGRPANAYRLKKRALTTFTSDMTIG